MPRREHPGIGRRLPKLLTAVVFIVVGIALVFKDYTAGFVGGTLDWLKNFDATRSTAIRVWPHYREWLAEPSRGLEWVHIAGIVMIAFGLVLILWRSQRPPEHDPG